MVAASFAVENLVTFSSPEKAFLFSQSGEIKIIEEGKNSAGILYYQGDTQQQDIIMRQGDRWKIGADFLNKEIRLEYEPMKSITVKRARGTLDYYVLIYQPFTSKVIEVSDNKGSEFRFIQEDHKEMETFGAIYYAYVYDLNDTYELYIDGKTIKLS